MNLEKLKDTARKFEQKEDWRRAIEVYLKAIQEFEAGRESTPDLSLYNRVGDLYLKVNDQAAAVRSYERAVDLYADQGFLNNAIALCGKILRVNPGRVPTYLKLAQLHARKNVLIEAKRNLLEYLDRMNAAGQLDEAFRAVTEFADHFSGNPDIRLMLVELLRASSRATEAREQLEKLAADLEARGDQAGARRTRERLQALGAEDGAVKPAEPGRVSGPAAPEAPAVAGRRNDLVFLDTSFEIAPMTPATPGAPVEPAGAAATIDDARAEPLEPLELEMTSEAELPEPEGLPSDLITAEPALDATEVAGVGDLLIEPSPSGEASPPAAPLGGFETTTFDGAEATAAGVAPLDGLLIDVPTEDAMASPPSPMLDGLDAGAGLDGAATLDGLDLVDAPLEIEGAGREEYDAIDAHDPLDARGADDDVMLVDAGADAVAAGLDTDAAPADSSPVDLPFIELGTPAPGDEIAGLEDRVLENPEDAGAHQALGEALLGMGQTERGTEELELALRLLGEQEAWDRAFTVAGLLVVANPTALAYHQKRVELAYRLGDRTRLLAAYLELADALAGMGADDKALAVYRRVLEHDAANERARREVERLSAPAAPAPVAAAPIAPPAAPVAPPAAPPAGQPPVATGPAATAIPPAAIPPAATPPSPPARASGGHGFVDLGSLVIDDEGPRDTRMRMEGAEEPPTSGDEQRDFDEMLAAFKRGIDENLEHDDYQAHYDLGVAFKEMGLLDEAIAEFQKALRAPEREGRLRTSEALGQAFYEKGQFAIAESVLRRAVDGLEGGDDEKIGLIYWLGRAAEEQGKTEAARVSYERALAVDIRFMDLGERIHRLTAGR